MPPSATPLEIRFREVNRTRLARLLSAVSERQGAVLQAIPLILHGNDPALPGYRDHPGPTGIRDFAPDNAEREQFKRLFAGFQFQPRALMKYGINGIYVMGSGSSIAFNSKSDFDLWICVTPSVDAQELRYLEERLRRIEQWAAGEGLEIHCFVLTREKFVDNPVSELSAEDSGTTQRHLLLEEFYRTGIILQGLPPIWWAVPSDQEERYDEYIRERVAAGSLARDEFLDFGGLQEVPAEEFLGASLWQLFKGMGSPYKSILKLVLLEIYASEYPRIHLLSHDYKQQVERGVTDVDQLDPYLLMYRKIETYLNQQQDTDTLDLVRRCLYLKVGEKLSRNYRAGETRTQRRLMHELVARWKWTADYLGHLDNHVNWAVSDVVAEHKNLVKKFSDSYLKLSHFTRSNKLSASISLTEMDLLGRKLQATLNSAPDKIDLVRTLPLPHPEGILTVLLRDTENAASRWNLFTGSLADVSGKRKPLKSFASLTMLLLWCHFNNVLGGRTRVLQPQDSPKVSGVELRFLQKFLYAAFPMETVGATTLEDLKQAPQTRHAVLLVNLGVDPFANHAQRGTHITSDRNDPLSYGMRQINTVMKLDYISLNSWGEIRIQSFDGPEALLHCMRFCLSEEPGRMLPRQIFGHDGGRGSLAALRIQELFQSLNERILATDPTPRQFLFPLGSHFIGIARRGAVTQLRLIRDELALLDELSAPRNSFHALEIDKACVLDSPLFPIAKLNEPDSIQVFVCLQGDQTDLYVLDENGSLFVQSTQSYRLRTHMRHMETFLQNLLRGSGPAPDDAIQYYQLKGDAASNWRFRKIDLPPLKSPQATCLTVSARDLDSARDDFRMAYGAQSWRSRDMGENLFAEAAAHIQRQRQHSRPYPAYLGKLDIEHRGNRPTVEFLSYKRWLEERLNNYLSPGDAG